MIDEKSSDAKLLEVLHEGGLGPKQAERLRGRVQWFEGYAFGRMAQHSLSTLEEVSLKKRKYVPSLATSVPLWSFLSEGFQKQRPKPLVRFVWTPYLFSLMGSVKVRA